MNAAGIRGLERQYPLEVGDTADLRGVADAAQAQKARLATPPDQDATAPSAEALERDPVLAMVAGVLGASLTTDSLAWRGDPVPVMRSLQKMLVAHSLTLPDARRQPALSAIRAVELAVRWRLRWMQMRRSEAESHFIPPQDDHATAPPA